MEYMPEELLKEIMLKLPTRSVARWKCVCKSWYSYLNSSDFIVQYLQLSNKNKIKHNSDDHDDLILKHSTKDNYRRPDVISILSHEIHGVVACTQSVGVKKDSQYIVDCCNGVVCLAVRNEDMHMLWNPKTKQVKVLPRTLYSSSNGLGHYKRVGFGYDDKNNDYKVVSLRGYQSKDYRGTTYHLEVYSLKLDCWRMVANNVKASDLYVNVNSLEEVGTTCTAWMIPWLMMNGRAVCSFEMSKEVIILTPLPSRPSRPSRPRKLYRTVLVDLNGHVAFSDYIKGIICNIWWLGEIGVEESWTKLFSIALQCNEIPLGFWNNSGLLLYKTGDCRELVLLDIATHQRKSQQTGIIPGRKIFNFRGSMTPIN